ncbi:hypothetical protein ACP275_07G081800 [Erythranthe tilingii]
MAAVCGLETASAQELFEGKMNFKGKLRELPVMVMSSKNVLLAPIGKLYDVIGLRFCNLFLPLKIDYSPATPFFLRCPPPTPPLHSHISFNMPWCVEVFLDDTYMKVYICISRVNLGRAVEADW